MRTEVYKVYIRYCRRLGAHQEPRSTSNRYSQAISIPDFPLLSHLRSSPQDSIRRDPIVVNTDSSYFLGFSAKRPIISRRRCAADRCSWLSGFRLMRSDMLFAWGFLLRVKPWNLEDDERKIKPCRFLFPGFPGFMHRVSWINWLIPSPIPFPFVFSLFMSMSIITDMLYGHVIQSSLWIESTFVQFQSSGIVIEQEPEAKLGRDKLLMLPQKSKTIGKLLSHVPFQPCFVGVGSQVLRPLDSRING